MTSDKTSNRVVVGLIRNKNHQLLILKVKEDKLSKYSNNPYVFPQSFLFEGELNAEGLEKHLYELTGYKIDAIAQASYQFNKELERGIYYYYCRTNSNVQDIVNAAEDFESYIWIPINKVYEYISNLNDEVSTLLSHIKHE